MRGALGLAVALWIAACGGREAPALDGGGSSTQEGGSSDEGGPSLCDGCSFPVCPTDAPTVGSPCIMSGEGCAYIDPSGACTAFVCDGSEHWQSSAQGC